MSSKRLRLHRSALRRTKFHGLGKPYTDDCLALHLQAVLEADLPEILPKKEKNVRTGNRKQRIRIVFRVVAAELPEATTIPHGSWSPASAER